MSTILAFACSPSGVGLQLSYLLTDLPAAFDQCPLQLPDLLHTWMARREVFSFVVPDFELRLPLLEFAAESDQLAVQFLSLAAPASPATSSNASRR